MLSPTPIYATQTQHERAIAAFLPYSSHISPNTLITQEGDLIRCWQLSGISFETVDADVIVRRKEQLNILYRSLASPHVSIWTHGIRRRIQDKLDAHFDNDFCKAFDSKYYASFADYNMMANEWYITVVYRPNPSRLMNALKRTRRPTVSDRKRELIASLKALDDIAYQLEASLSRYSHDETLKPLTVFEKDGISYSPLLSLFNFLISGEFQKVRVPNIPLNHYLGTAWLHVGTETIALRTPKQTRYAQCIDFKDYTAHTEPGMLNGLMYEPYEYVLTQSYSFLSKRQGKDLLERQLKQLHNTEDGSHTQMDELHMAIDQLIQGEFVMGEYHCSLMVFGENVETVRRNTTSAMALIQDRGFIAALVATATDAAFYAQLPANWAYRPRVAYLTSKNFAGLSSFHNFSAGKREGNPWGQAVTLFKTASGQPLYFNFHYSKGDEDAFDKKLLGNTRIIGQSGSGKTALLNTLLIQAQKYKTKSPHGFTTVFFDKDEGAKLCIKAIGGKYLSIKNGQPTGFNPFQIENTEENRLFLEKLVRVLVTKGMLSITTRDEQAISQAVRAVMEMPKAMRRLSIVLQNMTEGEDISQRENSLIKRLSQWCYDDGTGRQGAFAWVLDCAIDEIDFTTHTNYGFDGTHFLDNNDVRTPIAMYLLHRMNEVIDGRRFIYFMDEAWKWVDDEAFAEFAGNKQLTIRKQNGLGIFATQMPSSLLNSKIAAALVQQVATEIYLPNPKADKDEYLNGFKVSETEFELIKNLSEDSRHLLIKQGHHAMIGQLDLSGFEDELAILSGSADSVALMDEIVSEVGDNPNDWLPIFHARRKVRKTQIKNERNNKTPEGECLI